ncbi:MAG TPA: HEAT repeat domain-containing protein [Pirellulaceae bacterium]|nr:HEAT repeat domain-containing protein [Pirellulaceae bacterium]
MQRLILRCGGLVALFFTVTAAAEEPEQVDLATELKTRSADTILHVYGDYWKRGKLAATAVDMMSRDPDPANRLKAYQVWQELTKRLAQERETAIHLALKNADPSVESLVRSVILTSADSGVRRVEFLLNWDEQHPPGRDCGVTSTGIFLSTVSASSLRPLANHENPKIRALAVAEFARRSREDYANIEEVRKSLFHADARRRVEAIQAHVQLGLSPASDARIEELLADDDADVRKAAIGYFGSRVNYERDRVLAALQHSDAEVRRIAADALGGVRPANEETIQKLSAVIADDADAQVAQAAISSLADLDYRNEAAVPAIARRLRECQDRQARLAIIYCLDKIGPAAQSAVPDIRAVAADSEHSQLTIEHALWRITGEPEALLEAIRVALERAVRENIKARLPDAQVRFAGELGPAAKPLVPLLVAHLDYALANPPEPGKASIWFHSRYNTICALGAIGPDAKDALQSLESFDQSEHAKPFDHKAAAEAIAAIRGMPPVQP